VNRKPESTLPPRDELVARYRAGRAKSRELFSIVAPQAFYERPIALRNPIVFYEGHLPAFCVNTLVKLALGRPGIDERLETLFARGIDPEDESAVSSPTDLWPSRDEVRAYVDAADALIEETLLNAAIDDESRPCLRGGEAVYTILEHEVMHQETLLYMLHNLPHAMKRRPSGETAAPARRSVAREEMIDIPRGRAALGQQRGAFGWDNEFEGHAVDVDAFSVAQHNVTNGEFAEFVAARGYDRHDLWSDEGWSWIRSASIRRPHFWIEREGSLQWRGMFDVMPLDPDAPVYVTHAEASAYAKWRGARLMSEPEFHRAAYGTPDGVERLHPWGDAAPSSLLGNFDFASWDPQPVGSYPAGASAWGVEDLVGNGWEWTSTEFAPFAGFRPMPSYPVYSTDFFDGAHYVMKGASPVTGSGLIRKSFRNWFRPAYPYVYATFRIAR
jgi:gamma-glutamyl hercynylcysteine S-oxide synthase